MSTVTFYGASDDLIEVDGDAPGCDEYNAESALFTVIAEDGALKLRMFYGVGGTWQVELALLGEDHPMPDIQIGYNETIYNSYSPVVVIPGVSAVIREHDD